MAAIEEADMPRDFRFAAKRRRQILVPFEEMSEKQWVAAENHQRKKRNLYELIGARPPLLKLRRVKIYELIFHNDRGNEENRRKEGKA